MGQSLLQDLLPKGTTRNLFDPKLLREKYRAVIVGFEKYFTDDRQFSLLDFELEQALHDLNACAKCDGYGCTTFINSRDYGYRKLDGSHIVGRKYYRKGQGHNPHNAFWYGLNEDSTAFYKRPHFAYHQCVNPAQRKTQVLSMLQRLRAWRRQ